MFIILIEYIKPLAEIDKLIPEHRQFLERHYGAGDFLLSGRREPRTGGVILARGESREAVQRIVEEDPFFIGKVAEYRVVEFLPTMAAEGLERFKVAP